MYSFRIKRREVTYCISIIYPLCIVSNILHSNMNTFFRTQTYNIFIGFIRNKNLRVRLPAISKFLKQNVWIPKIK